MFDTGVDGSVLAAVPLLGVLVPFLVSYLKEEHWPAWVKQILTLGICAGAGVIAIGATQGFEDLTFKTLTAYGASVFVIAQTVYRLWFKDSGIDKQLTSVSLTPKA